MKMFETSFKEQFNTVNVMSAVESATAPDPGDNGIVSTSVLSVSKVNPAAARTGVILQPGTHGGQTIWVVNVAAAGSGFTISWDAQATSNIANEAGGTYVLAEQQAQLFVWTSGASLWHKAT
jgi:hypothetical protein